MTLRSARPSLRFILPPDPLPGIGVGRLDYTKSIIERFQAVERMLVKDFNVYRWAGHMLLDAARLRQRERVMSRICSHSSPALQRVV